MECGSSHPPAEGDNQGRSASTSGRDTKTRPNALASVVSPQNALGEGQIGIRGDNGGGDGAKAKNDHIVISRIL
ncbi:hypothetical protein V501_06487 [Pseudogymnoascus sp. VKM F-4519 (FW-2642)]|nr:hypothetical protein V501_06487 [Pseudogymnoascus sp. VKM F-4519 (FW-2642)]